MKFQKCKNAEIIRETVCLAIELSEKVDRGDANKKKYLHELKQKDPKQCPWVHHRTNTTNIQKLSMHDIQ